MIETKKVIMDKLKKEARESWSGKEGIMRSKTLATFLSETIKEYSKYLGLSQKKILNALEEQRNYSAINYYQRANFPSIKNVTVFNTAKDVKKNIPTKKFRCPACKEVSTDASICNSGKKIGKNKICDWKSYGLFGTLGKGFQFIVKEDFLEKAIVHEIFMPIDLESKC